MDPLARVLARTRRQKAPRGLRHDCRIWQGSTTSDGYGHVRTGSASWDYTHRITWRATHHGRPIPRDRIIDHMCRRRACCEPRHLRLVTYSENNRAGWETRRSA